MTAMQTFNVLQARQNAVFGHRSTSPQSVFDPPSAADGRVFDSFSDMVQNKGGANQDFCRQYGNGDGNGAVEIIKNG